MGQKVCSLGDFWVVLKERQYALMQTDAFKMQVKAFIKKKVKK